LACVFANSGSRDDIGANSFSVGSPSPSAAARWNRYADPIAAAASGVSDEAAREQRALRALRAAAAANGAKANLPAYRFPGYSMPLLDRICAAVDPLK
jgi:hypothetical protein